MKKNKICGIIMLAALSLSACAGGGGNSESSRQTVEAETLVVEENTSETELTTEKETTSELETTTEIESTTELETTTEEETTIENPEDFILWETKETTVDYSLINQVYLDKETERKSSMENIIKEKENPVMYITTEDGHTIKDKNYHAVTIDLFNCEKEYEMTAVNAEVKVRGNSSASSSPYPYRIRFEEKENILGLHDGEKYRSWAMLKPYWTFCPNYLALNLAKSIFDGEYYASDANYVNLYMNGKYLGLYLVCEQNQVSKGRVEVNEPEYGNTDVNVGYFIEIDNNIGDDHPFFELKYGNRTMKDMKDKEREIASDNYSVISDIWCDAQLKFISSYMEGVFEILYAGITQNKALALDENNKVVAAPEGTTAEEAIRAVIDVQSFMNMLLLEELVQNYDVGAGSFYFCVDFSDGAKYNKLTMTCPWDFNWAYSENPDKNYYAATWQKIMDNWDRSNIWFILLMKAKWFRKDFYEFVNEYNNSGKLSETLKYVETNIEKYRNDLGNDSWMVDKGYDIMNYVKKRMKFLINEAKDV